MPDTDHIKVTPVVTGSGYIVYRVSADWFGPTYFSYNGSVWEHLGSNPHATVDMRVPMFEAQRREWDEEVGVDPVPQLEAARIAPLPDDVEHLVVNR